MSDAAAPTADQPNVKAVPGAWPGAFGLYKHSKAAVMVNIETIVIGILAVLGVGIVWGIFVTMLDLPTVIDNVVQFIFNAFVMLVEVIILFESIDGKKISLGDAVKAAWEYLVQGVVLMLLLTLAAIVSLVLLIVPFFIVMPRLVLAPYYLVRKKMTATDALRASWDATKGSVGKVYGIVGVYILIILLAFTLIGIPFAIYFGIMYSAAFTILYAYLTKHGHSA